MAFGSCRGQRGAALNSRRQGEVFSEQPTVSGVWLPLFTAYHCKCAVNPSRTFTPSTQPLDNIRRHKWDSILVASCFANISFLLSPTVFLMI